MDKNKNLIEEFYNRLWNQWDYQAVDSLLSENISFRGSLGLTKKGHSGFIDYVEMIKSAFPDFHNTIEELICERNKVVARMTYSGTHQGTIFGKPPTGKKIEYAGVAIFHINNEKITQIWVLGDLYNLIKQISA